ncbi:MAG: radical SAM protein [Planctomycetes bacterium]|nr:radical SAM protein [Planctomycetota bacterium]
MADSQTPYRKHNSFVEIRQRRAPPEARARLEKVRAAATDMGLSPDAAALVRRACDEALGRATASAPHQPFTLQANVVEEIGRLTDAEIPRYLHYRYRYEVYPDRRLLDDYPPCLQIEPTSSCNFRCVFCYQTDKPFTARKNGHMGVMPLDLFKRVVDQAQGHVEAVTLASRGEPTLCPHLDKMLAYAAGKFLGLKVNTNASLLTEALCHALLAADVNTLVFSADAADETAYRKLRVGGDLRKVLENVKRFHDIRRRDYPASRLITRVSGVKVPGAGELNDMERFWGDYVDQVAFVNYNPWENAYEAPPTAIAAPCSDLWRRMFIWWDGRANPCDVDFKSTLSVGDAARQDLSALWRSGPYETLRRDHLEARRGSRHPCARCSVV